MGSRFQGFKGSRGKELKRGVRSKEKKPAPGYYVLGKTKVF